MLKKIKDIALSFVDSFTDYDPAQITPDLAEIALDQVFDDGIIKDIPVVRSVYGLAKAYVSIRDRGLVLKLVKFISSINSVSPDIRKSFKDKMNKKKDFKKK